MPFLKQQSAVQAQQDLMRITTTSSGTRQKRGASQQRATSQIKQMSIKQMNQMQRLLKKQNILTVVQERAVPEPQQAQEPIPQPKPQEESTKVPQADEGPAAAQDHSTVQSASSGTTAGLQRKQSVLHLENKAAPQTTHEIADQVYMYNPIDEKSNEYLKQRPKRPPMTRQPASQQLAEEVPAPSTTNNDQQSTLSEFHFQHFSPLDKYKKLQLKKPTAERFDINSVNEQQLVNARKILYDFSEEKLKQVTEQMINNEMSLDVRRLQSALFVSEVNASINDQHKAYVGSDLSSSLPHYLWLGLWGVLLGAGITLLIVFNAIKTLLNILSYMFYVFIVLEYVLMFAALKTGQYAKKPIVDEQNVEKVKRGKVCLAIPVGWGIRGLSEDQKASKRQSKIDVLTNTIDAALRVFDASDIYIFHNSSDQELPDRVMMECCARRCVYVPIGIGSKSISAYYGAMLGNWLGYEYVIVMDDDTRLPLEMTSVLNQPLDCEAYCFAIAAASNDDPAKVPGSAKLIIALQDIEYKLSDLSKLVQYNFTSTSSVLAPHGAINMWRTDVLVDIMNEHNCIFHGEDYQMGLIMRNRHPKSRLGIISNCIVNTVAPCTWRDLYMQRLTSWDLAAQQFLWGGFCASQRSAHYMQVLFCLPCSIDNLFIRVCTLEDVWTVLQDYLRVILIAYHIIFSIIYRYVNVVVLVMYLVVIASQWVIAFALQYVKLGRRPDLQLQKDVRLRAVLLFPIYRFMFSFVRVFALLRFFFKYESVKRNALPIKQMTLPQPKELKFAFPGLRNSESNAAQNFQNGTQFDFDMVSKIVQLTLNQQKHIIRKQSFSKFPVVLSQDQHSEVSRANMIQPERPPVKSREYSIQRSRYENSETSKKGGSIAEKSVK